MDADNRRQVVVASAAGVYLVAHAVYLFFNSRPLTITHRIIRPTDAERAEDHEILVDPCCPADVRYLRVIMILIGLALLFSVWGGAIVQRLAVKK